MTDSGRILGGALVGAVAGAVAAHLLLTQQGRQTLRQLRPALDEFAAFLHDVSAVFEAVTEAAQGDHGGGEQRRPPNTGSTAAG